MDIAYPFVPKSNARLKPGHFWPIKLSNSKYACGIVLDVPKEKGLYTTRMFYAGLLDWIGDSKPTARAGNGRYQIQGFYLLPILWQGLQP